ncbi:MAG: guanylate kinase [Firmicutes bacterium]|nr:guanylate kinase [Bacillota bacterium]
MAMDGLLVVISGPSGAGKGTVVKKLILEDVYALSISVTTRMPRTGEVDGREYFFTTKEDFEKLRDDNNLLEHATYVDNYYGTPRKYVEEQVALGKVVLLEIEVDGALQVKEKFPEAVLIFIAPPSLEELERRLVKRNTESEALIASRIKKAQVELGLISHYDYVVVNDSVKLAVEKINAIVTAERLRRFPKAKPRKCSKDSLPAERRSLGQSPIIN